jgi:hypothetical protein
MPEMITAMRARTQITRSRSGSGSNSGFGCFGRGVGLCGSFWEFLRLPEFWVITILIITRIAQDGPIRMLNQRRTLELDWEQPGTKLYSSEDCRSARPRGDASQRLRAWSRARAGERVVAGIYARDLLSS